MKKISLTITGIIISALCFILPRLGISVLETDIATTITTIGLVVGGLTSYVGRVRQGDITWYGKKKVAPTQ